MMLDSRYAMLWSAFAEVMDYFAMVMVSLRKDYGHLRLSNGLLRNGYSLIVQKLWFLSERNGLFRNSYGLFSQKL